MVPPERARMLILDDVSPIERIKLSAALAAAVKALGAAVSPLQRVKLAGEIARILAQLGEAVATLRPLKFSLSDKQGSSNELSRYLDRDLAALPPALQVFEAQSVSVLADTLGDRELNFKAREKSVIQGFAEGLDKAHVEAFDEIASRGVKVDIDAAEVLRKVDEANRVLRSSVAQDLDFVELQNTLGRLNETFTRERAELGAMRIAERDAIRRGERNGDEGLREIEQKEVELYEKYKADFAEIKKKAEGRQTEFNAEKTARALELFKDEGERVLNSILAASPVSQAEAEEWAAKQVIDSNAAAKLSRLGYKKADVVRDLAEFYRMVGGKSSAVRISAGGRRANAVGVETRADEKVINLGTRFDKGVLFHELAHFLENDPIAKAASNGFLVKRREGPQAHSLRSLTGNKGYDAREVAYKDSFMDAYVGKIYRDGVTEVFSMGVQYLANPKDAAIFAAKDPEMFAMISGYLTSTLTPAMQAKLHMHEGAVEDIQAKREDKATSYDAALKALAAQVTITKDDWWDRVKDESYEAQSMARYYFDSKKPPTYLGSFGDYRLFQGLFKNRNTKRKANGFMVVTDRMGRLDSYAVHGGLDAAKAFIALTEQTGLSLSGVWHGYFWETTMKDTKTAVINAAQSAVQGKPE